MKQNDNRTIKAEGLSKVVSIVLIVTVLLSAFSVPALATTGKTEVQGKVYEFGKDSHYEFSDSDAFTNTNAENTYGTFSISGNISNVSSRDGVPAYEVAEGKLAFFYNYGDAMLNANEDSWYLIDDKSKKIDVFTLDANVMKGAIILQMSKDRKTWIDADVITNAFSDTPIRTSSIYSTTDVQLINGCFYRVIVAYELRIRTEDSNILFINTDKYEYKKCVEIYEFYAYTDSGETDVVDPNQTYSLGKKTKVENFDGYSGEEVIDKDDIHYGWELGNFFVSGYTDEAVDTNGNMVFLKNVGDKVTLWFKLQENINGLNGQDDLSFWQLAYVRSM